MAFFQRIMDWLRSFFWKQEMEITLVGLQNAGKTTFLNILTEGNIRNEKDTIPTIGLNTRKVTKGNVSIKLWDIGGQPRFRAMWERYCRGVNCIVYVIDSSDQANIEQAKIHLHELMLKNALQGIPVLVLGNKNDLPNHMSERDIVKALELENIVGREITCYSISAKNNVNVDVVLNWLIRHAKSKA